MLIICEQRLKLQRKYSFEIIYAKIVTVIRKGGIIYLCESTLWNVRELFKNLTVFRREIGVFIWC